nr:hypothetical protein [Blastococcus sp. TML/C7B]
MRYSEAAFSSESPSGAGYAAAASISAYSAKAPGPLAGEPMTRCPVSTISPHSSTPGV